MFFWNAIAQAILMLQTEIAQEVRGQNGLFLCCRTHLCLNEVSEVISENLPACGAFLCSFGLWVSGLFFSSDRPIQSLSSVYGLESFPCLCLFLFQAIVYTKVRMTLNNIVLIITSDKVVRQYPHSTPKAFTSESDLCSCSRERGWNSLVCRARLPVLHVWRAHA